MDIERRSPKVRSIVREQWKTIPTPHKSRKWGPTQGKGTRVHKEPRASRLRRRGSPNGHTLSPNRNKLAATRRTGFGPSGSCWRSKVCRSPDAMLSWPPDRDDQDHIAPGYRRTLEK